MPALLSEGSPSPRMLTPASLWAPTQSTILTTPCPHEARTHGFIPSASKAKRLLLGRVSLKEVCSEHSQEGPGRINAAYCPRVALKTKPFPGLSSPSLPIFINSMFSFTAQLQPPCLLIFPTSLRCDSLSFLCLFMFRTRTAHFTIVILK